MEKYIRSSLTHKFEFYNFGHALEILSESFPQEWNEIQDSLECFKISVEELIAAGGNQTTIPKKFDEVLYPLGWREIRITGDLLVRMFPRGKSRGRFSDTPLTKN